MSGSLPLSTCNSFLDRCFVSTCPNTLDSPPSGETAAHSNKGAQATLPMRYYEGRSRFRIVDVAELWRYRETIWILGLRDLKVRYRQTLIGVAWAILQPLTMMLVFATLFHLMGHMPIVGAVPYAVVAFCGLLGWQLFSTTVTGCSNSLVTNRNMITKIYFPRLALPLSTIVVGIVDLLFAMLVLVGLMAWYGIFPSWHIVTLPLFIALAALTSLAVGIWLSALNAIYRDVGFVVPFLIQVGFFLSPVVYETASVIPKQWQPLYALNPMVGVLEGFRWALLGKSMPPWEMMGVSFTILLAILIGGLIYFRHTERSFADRI